MIEVENGRDVGTHSVYSEDPESKETFYFYHCGRSSPPTLLSHYVTNISSKSQHLSLAIDNEKSPLNPGRRSRRLRCTWGERERLQVPRGGISDLRWEKEEGAIEQLEKRFVSRVGSTASKVHPSGQTGERVSPTGRNLPRGSGTRNHDTTRMSGLGHPPFETWVGMDFGEPPRHTSLSLATFLLRLLSLLDWGPTTVCYSLQAYPGRLEEDKLEE